jgi:hypothetical protein
MQCIGVFPQNTSWYISKERSKTRIFDTAERPDKIILIARSIQMQKIIESLEEEP